MSKFGSIEPLDYIIFLIKGSSYGVNKLYQLIITVDSLYGLVPSVLIPGRVDDVFFWIQPGIT